MIVENGNIDIEDKMKISVWMVWVLRIIAAAIMLQTLYFKFSAHPMSVELFTILGMEPYGRISIGVMELIASVLILYPRTTGLGALAGLALMSGAIFFHLTKLSVYFGGDALLFGYALIVLIDCALLAYLSLKLHVQCTIHRFQLTIHTRQL